MTTMPRYQTCDTLLLLLAYTLINPARGVCWSLESRGPRPQLRWVSPGPARELWAAHWAELSSVWDATSVGHTSRRSGDCHNLVTLSRELTHITSQTSDQSLVIIRTLVVIKPNSFTNKWVEETVSVYEVMKIFSIISMNISNGKQLFVNSIHSLRIDWGRKVLDY